MRKKGELGKAAMWRAYRARYGSTISMASFTQALEACNKGMVSLLLAGVELKLPHRLGTFYVEKKKVNFNHLSVDFGHWQKTGQKLFHLNRHSDNFRAHLHWRKITAILVGKQYYKFTPCRGFNRALAQVMLREGGHKHYQEFKRLS